MNYNKAELCKDCKMPVAKQNWKEMSRIVGNNKTPYPNKAVICWSKRDFKNLERKAQGTPLEREIRIASYRYRTQHENYVCLDSSALASFERVIRDYK